jgi:hypothetical protein
MAAQAMQNQTQQFRQQAQSQQQQQQNVNVPTFPQQGQPQPQPQQQDSNPLAGLMSFLGGVNSPPPPTQPTRTIPIKPVREMKSPSGMGIGDILNKIQKEEKKVGSNLPPQQPMFQVQTQGPPAPITTSAPPPPPRAIPARSALRKSAGSERKSAKNSVVIKL